MLARDLATQDCKIYPIRQPFTVVCMMSRMLWRILGGQERNSLMA